jgi:hypothetical protein
MLSVAACAGCPAVAVAAMHKTSANKILFMGFSSEERDGEA